MQKLVQWSEGHINVQCVLPHLHHQQTTYGPPGFKELQKERNNKKYVCTPSRKAWVMRSLRRRSTIHACSCGGTTAHYILRLQCKLKGQGDIQPVQETLAKQQSATS